MKISWYDMDWLGEGGKNGERFANMCAFNKTVTGGTIFQHERMHEATCVPPNHTTQNQIGHFASLKISEGQWKV